MLILPEIVDRNVLDAAVAHARGQGVRLPTFAQLASPSTIPAATRAALGGVPAEDAHPLNLFRIHWYNEAGGGVTSAPAWFEIPSALSGVAARIVVMPGDGFPMIAAHKVLAAYACLVTRLVTGRFDPAAHRAVWPSTGNYCRGGVAISRILGCRGVAVLPEQMSRERYQWLEEWTLHPEEDIVRTTGSESNVREIYEACDAIARDPASVVLNQFNEFANYLCHRQVTGPAVQALYGDLARPGDNLFAFVTGTGSAGTIAAGDHLKRELGARIVAMEPVECPTLLVNGYGEHNIQGIGDKHVPLIHNVMNMDAVVGVSDSVPELMNLLFNTGEGQGFLARRAGVEANLLKKFSHVGLSGLANVQAAIKLARYHDLDEHDVIICMATDGASMYASEMEESRQAYFGGDFGAAEAAEVFGRCLTGCEPSYLLECTHRERQRIFNLGYYTWVEQRGVALAEFDARKRQGFWDNIADSMAEWDELIVAFNEEVGLGEVG